MLMLRLHKIPIKDVFYHNITNRKGEITMTNNEISLIGSDIISYDNNDKEIYLGKLGDIKVTKNKRDKKITVIIDDSKSFKDIVVEESYKDRREYNLKSICNKELI
jgi:hypothetical protein